MREQSLTRDVIVGIVGNAIFAMALVLGHWLVPLPREVLWIALGIFIGALFPFLWSWWWGKGYSVPWRKKDIILLKLGDFRDDLCLGCNVPSAHVRTSLMFPSRDRTRRKVFFGKGYEEQDLDNDLELRMYSGLSGLAWNYKSPQATGDLARLHAEIRQGNVGRATFLMLPQEAAKVRPSMDSMLAVPVEHPNRKGELIACLCADSDTPIVEARFDDAETFRKAQEWARDMARILRP